MPQWRFRLFRQRLRWLLGEIESEWIAKNGDCEPPTLIRA